MKLRALRGATTVDANEPEAILSATEELVREVMQRNALEPEQMVSCIFTCTDDLDAEFPAAARPPRRGRPPRLPARGRVAPPRPSGRPVTGLEFNSRVRAIPVYPAAS